MASPDGLTRDSPESVGVNSSSISAFLDDAANSGVELNSFMLYRSGKVISEGWWFPYRPELPHALHSATKSFLSVGVGLAIHEGYFKLSDKVVTFFPDRIPQDSSSYLLSMTVADLLTQTSGHGYGQSGGEWRGIEGSWVDKFFIIPVEHEPGTTFVYSSATSLMLSAIISKTTGQSVRDFLEPRLFRPLGIKKLTWDVGPEGINPGGNGISCLSSDFLKLGILHLQKGVWNGERILPEDWVEKVATPQRGNSYSYHWWLDTNVKGVYFAAGMLGQMAMVFPEHDAVLITTAAVGKGAQALRALVARHFPVMFTAPLVSEDGNVPSHALKARLGSLRLLPPLATTPHPRQALVVSNERFVTKPNEDDIVSFALDFHNDKHCVFHLQQSRGFHRVQVGLDDWVEGETSLPGAKLHHGYEWCSMRVVAGGRWTKEDTFEITLQFNETAFRDTITITFFNTYTAARLDRRVNVNSFSTQRPTVLGAILVTGDELKLLNDDAKKVYSVSTSTIGELLDNPATRLILEEEVPAVVKDPRIEKARMYTLDIVYQRVPDLKPDIMARIEERLSRLK